MATLSNLQDFNNIQNAEVYYPMQRQDNNSMANGITNAITGTVNGISGGISNTMNSIPHIMDEQRKNFVFQFQEVMECVNLMERQGIINRPQQVTVTEREHVGFGKFIAIVVGGCWLVIKLAAIVL